MRNGVTVVKKMFLIVLAALLVAAAALWLWLRSPQFGRPPSAHRLARMKASPQWCGDRFARYEPAEIITSKEGIISAWGKFFFTTYPDLVPDRPLPSYKTDLRALPPDRDALVWFGHSSFLLKLSGMNIVADPVFCGYASPVPFVSKAFPGTDVYASDDMPDIDVLVISHEHWDHLDYKTICALRPKIKNVVCPLGIGEYFEMWGLDPAVIREGDWGDSFVFGALTVHVLPAQHYAQRLFKRDQTLCAGFAFTTPGRRVYYTGDSGWAGHVEKIAQKFAPFDLMIAENGQYNADWRHIHMFPEETAKAAGLLGARAVLPVHSGKFALARHPWYEPFERLSAVLAGTDTRLLTPVIGQTVFLDEEKTFSPWWRSYMPQKVAGR